MRGMLRLPETGGRSPRRQSWLSCEEELGADRSLEALPGQKTDGLLGKEFPELWLEIGRGGIK